MFRNLWFKLVTAFVIVILVTLLLFWGVVARTISREMTQYTQARTDFARSLISDLPSVTRFPRPAPLPEVRAPDALQLQMPTEIVIVNGTEERIVVQPEELGNVLNEVVVRAAEGGSTGFRFLSDVQRISRIALIVSGLAAILLGTVVVRQVTRPLESLRKAVQSFAQGDMSVRIPVKSNDEVGKVAAAFNQMASQLERQERLRQQIVADVAHELRTPLSVMQGNIEAMMDGLLQPDATELAGLHDELQRLTRLITDLRTLSLAEAGQLSLELKSLNARRLVEQTTSRMAPLAEAHSVILEVNGPTTPCLILGDQDRLQQVLTNLIDNSIRHSPPEETVTLEISLTKEHTQISVADHGPGIAPEDLPYVFERFWRGDKSRSRQSGGSGLGLSIVRQLVQLHGGSVQVTTPENGGCRFDVLLPRAA